MCPPLDPILTRHTNGEQIQCITISHSRPSLHPKEVYSCVPSLGISDVQGAVLGPGISKEEESALGLTDHRSGLFVATAGSPWESTLFRNQEL